jgi:hypothetical protein
MCSKRIKKEAQARHHGKKDRQAETLESLAAQKMKP